MLSFIVGMVIILGSICFILSLIFKITYSLYRRYKFINSPEFKTMSDSISRAEKLSFTYQGMSKLAGILFFVFLGTLLINAKTWIVLVALALLIFVLYYNSQVLNELKNYESV